MHDALIDYSTPIPDDINVSKDDTSDLEHVLVESSMPVHVARYSLVISVIEVGIEHETVDTGVIASSKPSEFTSLHDNSMIRERMNKMITVKQVCVHTLTCRCAYIFLSFIGDKLKVQDT